MQCSDDLSEKGRGVLKSLSFQDQIRKEKVQSFARVSGEVINVARKNLNTILTLLPTCARRSNTTAAWVMIISSAA